MILVLCHPVFGDIKLCNICNVEEAFAEINEYLKINKLETIAASTGSGPNSTGVRVFLGRYEYPSKTGFCLNYNNNEYHLYEVRFGIHYEAPKRHSDGKITYIRNLNDITDIKLPQLIPEDSELIRLEKDEIGSRFPHTYHDFKYMIWAYPDGYNHIKRYLEDFEIRKGKGSN